MTITTEQTEIQLKITIPKTLFNELEANIPAEQRDQFFINLLERELRRERLKHALKESAGAWKAEDHPELAEPDGVEKYVRRIRETWMPRSWDEIIEGDADA
ncbi:MAG: hypothetical protein KDJ52_10490 [Anaerolineae bacterium]|nr:hypothetical protein [Anaerolineae bacterium]